MCTENKNTVLRFVTFIAIFIFLGGLIAIPVVFAQGSSSYVPLSPLPGVDEIDTGDLTGFFNQLFIISIGAAALLAVLMIAIGGLQYMGKDAWSTKQDAKDRILGAVLGLLILLFAWLLLSTINPKLVSFDFFSNLQRVEFPNPPAESAGGGQPPEVLEEGEGGVWWDREVPGGGYWIGVSGNSCPQELTVGIINYVWARQEDRGRCDIPRETEGVCCKYNIAGDSS